MKKINFENLWEKLVKSCVLIKRFNGVEFVLKRWSDDALISIKIENEPTNYRTLNDFESFKSLFKALIEKTKLY